MDLSIPTSNKTVEKNDCAFYMHSSCKNCIELSWRQVCYQHLATIAVPPEHQGRIFSLLNVLSSVGRWAIWAMNGDGRYRMNDDSFW